MVYQLVFHSPGVNQIDVVNELMLKFNQYEE